MAEENVIGRRDFLDRLRKTAWLGVAYGASASLAGNLVQKTLPFSENDGQGIEDQGIISSLSKSYGITQEKAELLYSDIFLAQSICTVSSAAAGSAAHAITKKYQQEVEEIEIKPDPLPMALAAATGLSISTVINAIPHSLASVESMQDRYGMNYNTALDFIRRILKITYYRSPSCRHLAVL